ncbi:MAG: hypothetical protein E7197_06325 [Anaerovibrio sp.]|uniref:hypothetical protein n=1 Tax=Anaerovibrio sp. TaxID=1872532 RepID=UPI0025C35E17|nr:hypothetical protein [Anaerovibrio sp.]MBE6099656.1 hypothetical protein [Anaerovibrio sp.]
MDIFEDFDASHGAGAYTSVSDGIGGQTIMHHGMAVGHEAPLGKMDIDGEMRVPNAVGGTDIVKGGNILSHSVPNSMGGNNVYHGHELHHITMPNVYGGVNVYDSHMHLEGFSMDNGIGGETYLSLSGNTESITNYDNPLAHSAECRFDPFKINSK